MRRDALGFLTEIARRYGDVARFRIGPTTLHILSRPEWIRDLLVTHADRFHKGRGLERAKRVLGQGLLTSEDPVHLRQRRMMQPAFHRERIAGYASVMAEYAARHAESWRDGDTRDMSREMSRLTMAIVGKTLLDADVASDSDEIGRALTDTIESFGRTISLQFFPILDRLPFPSNRRFDRARERIDSTIARLIAERRRSPKGRTDLLTMLVAAQDVEGDGTGMSDSQVRDETVTIFLAGHETTANALAWTWYLLSQNPEVETRLHRELDAFPENAVFGFGDLSALRYTEMVLAESMRLYPPAWILGRRALVDYEVGGYVIPKGSIVAACQWVTHRDPRFFPEPERFDPERFRAEVRETRPKFSYFPFGGGPRVCIGESFAWMEGVLLLATLARRWRMRLTPGQTVVPLPSITLRPKHGMRMVLEKRPERL